MIWARGSWLCAAVAVLVIVVAGACAKDASDVAAGSGSTVPKSVATATPLTAAPTSSTTTAVATIAKPAPSIAPSTTTATMSPETLAPRAMPPPTPMGSPTNELSSFPAVVPLGSAPTDCGSSDRTSGGPTTIAPAPMLFDCIPAKFAAGQSAILTLFDDPTDNWLPKRRIFYEVTGPSTLRVMTVVRGGTAMVPTSTTTQICTALTHDMATLTPATCHRA